MDVVDTRADLVRISVLLEGLEKLHVALGCLDGDDISIKTLDGWEDVVEVGVTEMRVSLELIGDTGCGEFEGVNSPLEVGVPVSAAKGQLRRVVSNSKLHLLGKKRTPSRIAGSSTWMALIPAFSRSTTSSRRARASCLDCNSLETSARGKDQLRMVTGPVSIPFIGLVVKL